MRHIHLIKIQSNFHKSCMLSVTMDSAGYLRTYVHMNGFSSDFRNPMCTGKSYLLLCLHKKNISYLFERNPV